MKVYKFSDSSAGWIYTVPELSEIYNESTGHAHFNKDGNPKLVDINLILKSEFSKCGKIGCMDIMSADSNRGIVLGIRLYYGTIYIANINYYALKYAIGCCKNFSVSL